MDETDRQDLDWLAFRYIANEMGVSEIEAFESRLADDQSAREAVARAVEWSAAIAAAPAGRLVCTVAVEPIVRRRGLVRRWSSAARWMAAAAAAVVAGVVGFRMWPQQSDVAQLAKMWGAIRVGSDALDATDAHWVPDDWSLDEEDDVTVPGWMFEAVRGSSDETWEDS